MARSRKPKEPGENRKMLANALEAWKRPRVDVRDTQAIADRIEEYLKYCMDNDVSPGIMACASWLGIPYHTLLDWYGGRSGTPEHQRIAARFYGIAQNILEQDLHEGNIDNISGIFLFKSLHGLKDTQEIVVKQSGTVNALSDSELIERSRRLPGAERLLSADDTPTIDVEATVIEHDPHYERAVERYKRIEERKKAVEAYKPIKKAKKKEYLKEYYREHKAEQLERNKRSIAKAKAQKEAQKAADQAQKDAERPQKE